jgi:hypothetical protein
MVYSSEISHWLVVLFLFVKFRYFPGPDWLTSQWGLLKEEMIM